MTNAKPKHKCPAPGCERMVRQSHLTCVGHWFTVPEHLRSRLWAAYRSMDAERHRQAMADCISFLEAAEITRVATKPQPRVHRPNWRDFARD